MSLNPTNPFELSGPASLTASVRLVRAAGGVEAQLIRAGVGDDKAAVAQPHGSGNVEKLVLGGGLQSPPA